MIRLLFCDPLDLKKPHNLYQILNIMIILTNILSLIILVLVYLIMSVETRITKTGVEVVGVDKKTVLS